MMRSPCHSRKERRRRRALSPFKIWQSPSTKPSSAKRSKNSRPVLKSRNGRSLVTQLVNCRKSEAPTVIYLLVTFAVLLILFLHIYQAELHSLFANLSEELAVEQRENAKMQQRFFKMMSALQNFVVDGATQSCKNLGRLSEKLSAMHSRCIPEYSRVSYDMGIDATNFRHERNKLQKRENIGRKAAEEMMRETRLKDLNIVADFIPPEVKPRTARTIRATTRKITSQLRAANLETAGAKHPLPRIKEIPPKKRDATPEVSFIHIVSLIISLCLQEITLTHSRTHTHTTGTHIHTCSHTQVTICVCVCRKCSTWLIKWR